MTTNKVALEGEVFFALCKSVDTAVSLGCWMRYKYGEHLQLASFEVDPDNYLSSSAFRKDYLVASYLSKWKGLRTGLDLKQEALLKFKQSEVQCARTNRSCIEARLVGYDPHIESVIFTAQRKIARILGPFRLEKVRKGGWGPGATYDLKRSEALPDTKMSKLPFTVTRRALPYFLEELRGDLHWLSVILGVKPSEICGPLSLLSSNFQIIEGCKITTVAKNAKTDRVIAIEPRLNGFLQKGVGGFIRDRLKSVGINLRDQTVNQRGAQRAYVDRLATIDLKAASDTVSREVVYDFLPVDWALALDDLRSPFYKVDEEWIRAEKFSSMGNGFTFELETLIFWALASACVPDERQQDVMVYGDDIIVPSECAPLLIEVLNRVGFSCNEKKTHIKGLFYESCGKHYFGNDEVTPIYQKEICLDDDLSVVRCGNRIIRYSLRYADRCTGHLDPVCESAWKACWRYGKTLQRYQIPLGVQGDDGWAVPRSDFDYRVPYDANRGYRCHVISIVPDKIPANEPGLLALSLRIREDTKRSEADHEFAYRQILPEVGYLESLSMIVGSGVPSWFGDVPTQKETTRASRRFSMPTREFGYVW